MLNFLNSTNRSYNGADLNKINEAILGTGVLDTAGDQSDLEVVKTTGLDVKAKKGSAVITVVQNSIDTNVIATQNSDTSLTCSANATNYIIFRVYQSIITTDAIDTAGTNSDAVEVVTALPSDPYILLATVTVPDGATAITDDMIKDNRVFANIKQYMIDDIVQFVFDNDPLGNIDIYSDGVDIENTSGSDVIGSTSDFGANGVYVSQAGDNSYIYRLNLWQRFTAPVDELGSVFLKKGITREDWNRGIGISICTVGAGGTIGSVIETFNYTATEWQSLTPNTEFELKLTGTYTQGTEYGILFGSNSSSDSDDSAVLITASVVDAGIPVMKRNFEDLAGTSPFDEYYDTETHLWFRVNTREVVNFGTSTNNKIGQVFTSGGKDVVSIELKKGTDQGSPTGNINIYLYEVDENNDPINSESPVSEKTITEDEWNDISTDEEFKVNLSASISLKTKYMFSIEPENISDTNYRQLWAGTLNNTYDGGTMRKAVGSTWSDLDFDLFFRLVKGAGGKVVQTNEDGFIDPSLIKQDGKNLVNFSLQGIEFTTPNSFMVCSPSGTSFAWFDRSPSSATIRYYKLINGNFTKVGQTTITTVTYARAFFIDDDTVVLTANHTSYDVTNGWVTDINVNTSFSNSSPTSTRDFFFSNTGAATNVVVNQVSKQILVNNGTADQANAFNLKTYASEGIVTGLGIPNFNNSANFPAQGYTPNGEIIANYTNKYTPNADGTFTAAGGVGTTYNYSTPNFEFPITEDGDTIEIKPMKDGSNNHMFSIVQQSKI